MSILDQLKRFPTSANDNVARIIAALEAAEKLQHWADETVKEITQFKEDGDVSHDSGLFRASENLKAVRDISVRAMK